MLEETTVHLKNHEEIRALFGPRDEYMRRLRRATGTQIILRGNVVHVQGTAEQVRRCEDLLKLWRDILGRNEEFLDGDVVRTLDSNLEGEELHNDVFDNNSRSGDVQTVPTEPRNRDVRAGRIGKDKVSSIRPKTDGQRAYVTALAENSLVFCDGPAGCGKTYLAVATAMRALHAEEVRKIVLVRPAVEAGEKLGFLPGDMFAKVNPFVRPLLDAMNDMLDFDQVKRYMANDVIEIAPLAFMRGRTLNDTFMILDEGQNTTTTQMKMFLTRMGVNSRIVVTGDGTQNDLPKGTKSGLTDGIQRLSGIEGVAIVRLTGQDIVRHRLVRQIVSAYETNRFGDDSKG